MANKLYTITEYGSFTRDKTADGYVKLPTKVFDSLENFVLSNATNETEALDLMSVSVRKNIGKVITAKNYVGVVALNDGSVIEILPKICGEDDTDNVKKLLVKMLRCLKNSPFKSMQTTNVNADKLPLFEIFIRMFINEAFAIVKKGLKSGYETIEENSSVCKGKIDFTKQVKYNFVHKERFYVEYDEFNCNRPENKLIKSTLLYLIKRTTSSKNKSDLKTLLNSFEMVDVSNDYNADFKKCVNDRNSKYYDLILMWCKVFLKGESFTSFAGSQVAYALLFPMEFIFESYVANKLKKYLNSNEYIVSAQHSGKYLFDKPKKFSLRPDIVITRKSDGAVFIMDTKWKLLNNNSSANYGISQTDMYQMYAYQKKYENARNVTLLYPLTENISDKENINYSSDDGVKVNVKFVDLKCIEKSFENLEL